MNRKEWHTEWRLKYIKRHPAKHLMYLARARSKRKGVECTITEEDIHIPEVCPHLGVKMETQTKLGEDRAFTMTLDRIDNSKGYVPGNVEVISWLANTMKNNATPEQLVNFAKAILERYERTSEH